MHCSRSEHVLKQAAQCRLICVCCFSLVCIYSSVLPTSGLGLVPRPSFVMLQYHSALSFEKVPFFFFYVRMHFQQKVPYFSTTHPLLVTLFKCVP